LIQNQELCLEIGSWEFFYIQKGFGFGFLNFFDPKPRLHLGVKSSDIHKGFGFFLIFNPKLRLA
jgi:hypothetical protein